jgi:hypothetical protein
LNKHIGDSPDMACKLAKQGESEREIIENFDFFSYFLAQKKVDSGQNLLNLVDDIVERWGNL